MRMGDLTADYADYADFLIGKKDMKYVYWKSQ